jgi:hypothetical protein
MIDRLIHLSKCDVRENRWSMSANWEMSHDDRLVLIDTTSGAAYTRERQLNWNG